MNDMSQSARAAPFRRLGFAHSYLFHSFPPYRTATIAVAISVVAGALGLWLMPSNVAPIIPKPVSASAPQAPSPPQTQAQQPPAPQPLTGDYQSCNATGHVLSADALQAAIAACGRIIAGTATGSGTLTVANAEIDRGLAYVQQYNSSAAVADFSQAIADGTSGYFIFYLRSFAENQGGNFQAALDDANKALAQQPTDSGSLVERSYAEIGLNDYQAAVTDATAALANGNVTTAYLDRGEAEYELGDYQSALVDENKVLNANSKTFTAYYWKAVAEERLGNDFTAAANDLMASLEIDPQYAPSLAELGLIALKQQRLTDALGYENRAVALFDRQPSSLGPNYPFAHALALNTRSAVEIRNMDFAGARTDATAAIGFGPIVPLRAAAFQNLGLADYDLGDYTDAVTAFSQALSLNPGSAELNRLLGEAQQYAGRKQ